MIENAFGIGKPFFRFIVHSCSFLLNIHIYPEKEKSKKLEKNYEKKKSISQRLANSISQCTKFTAKFQTSFSRKNMVTFQKWQCF